MSPRTIALIGMRGSGKSAVGRFLADRLGRRFVDLDDEVLRFALHAGLHEGSIGDLLDRVGLARFRDLEAAELKKLIEPAPEVVLATGGGVVERADNRAWLERVPTCVWLSVPVEILQERIARDPRRRPPVLGADAVSEVPDLLGRREHWYRSLADLVIEAGDRPPDVLAEQILTELGGEEE